MYGLFGLSHNIQNVYRLAAPFVGERDVEKMRDLKPFYLDFLQNLHRDFPIHRQNDLVVKDPDVARTLVQAFSGSKINDLEQEQMVAAVYDGDDFARRADLVLSAVRKLEEINPELGELFHLAVHGVLLAGSGSNKAGFTAHGGSSNTCIGLIWLSLKDSLSTQDLVEMLIHELTHTLVFVDELNFEHFNYAEMTKSKNWARSSILKRPRPMDKVLHSIVVSTEILHARAKYLPNVDRLVVHPQSKSLRESTLVSIESVLAHPNLNEICKPRAIELVEAAKVHLQTL